MGSYKDMINMIGNVKHIPSIIENAIRNSTKKMNIGGTYNSNDPYDPFTPGDGGPGSGGPGTGTGTGTGAGPGAGGFSGFSDVSIEDEEIYTGTGDPFGRPPVEPQPRGGGGSSVTGAGVGTSVSRMSGDIDRKATKGGGSLSLTPYNIDTTIDSPFVSKSVAMYDDGGNLQNVGMPQVNMPLSMEELFLRQLFQESRFNSNAVSSAGATSMAQVMPDAFEDGLKKGYVPKGTKYGDLVTNPQLARQFQESYMNDLMSREWNVGEKSKSKRIQQAKALAAYNLGPTGLLRNLDKQKQKGVDVNASMDWISGLPKETRDYVNQIMFGGSDVYEKNFIKLSKPFRSQLSIMDAERMKPLSETGEITKIVKNKILGRSYKKGGKFKNGGKKKALDEPVGNVMLPEIEFFDLSEDSYNKLSQPQKNIYDNFKTSTGQMQYVRMPDGRLTHWTKLMQMVDDVGMDKIINEPHSLAQAFPQKMRVNDVRFRPHFNPFTRNIHISGRPERTSTSPYVETIDIEDYVSDLIAETAHFPQFYRLQSLYDVPASHGIDMYRLVTGQDVEQRYQDPNHYEYHTHNAPDSFENQLMDKYTVQKRSKK